LEEGLPVLLVFGGSRGARSINQALIAVLSQLLPCCQIVHITGQLDWPTIADRGLRIAEEFKAQNPNSQNRYHPYAYLHDKMVPALAAADLAVARAGASTMGEFPAVGLPSILVPYPYAGRHQAANAAYLAERGAALVLTDSNLCGQMASTVLALLDKPAELAKMSGAAAALARPDAAANIVRELQRIARM
jgi:UDP-N-acetylglucosamine--N-acetylmuramyl-(pentapeptide) pyrophosphoryl-undecaprenol N-acetylglucosamine transferase